MPIVPVCLSLASLIDARLGKGPCKYYIEPVSEIDSSSLAESPHESLTVAVLLSVLGGFLDAYTYLLKGGVFANAQTGNVVLLGIALVSGASGKLIKYLLPIIAFSLGILFSEALKGVERLNRHNRWVKIILLVESLIMLALGLFSGHFNNLVITSVVSFLAAIQATSFRRVKGNLYATTMITGNLRSAMEQARLAFLPGGRENARNAVVYFTVIITFGLGASLGALCCRYLADRSIFACLLFTCVSFILVSLSDLPRHPPVS
jgi:uncharacterized membrane protein YoaK (UPF0700 family)